jgi:hypothetical protein
MSGHPENPSPPRRCSAAAGVCFVLLVLFASAAPVRAASASTSTGSPVFGAKWSKYLSGLETRTNVVRICVAVMALALFIMIKKFDGSQEVRARGQGNDRRGFSRDAESSERSAL